MFKRVLVSLLFVSSFASISSVSAYNAVDCSSDSIFTENACGQCFDGGSKGEGSTIGLLSDKWINDSKGKRILYTEEQTDPEMINLDTDNVRWIQSPSSENFWEHPSEFTDIFSEDQDGYILNPGEQVTWIKSKLSSAYKLEKNNVAKGGNVGLLVFPISTHNMLDNGEITIEPNEHNECVLFTSSDEMEAVITPVPTKKLPQTGPSEYILLLFFAMILGFGILQLRRKA